MRIFNECVIVILYELSRGDSTQTEICREHKKTFAAINNAKNYLMGLGLVEVRHDLSSRRTKIIGLTQKAIDLKVPKIITDFIKLEKEILNDRKKGD